MFYVKWFAILNFFPTSIYFRLTHRQPAISRDAQHYETLSLWFRRRIIKLLQFCRSDNVFYTLYILIQFFLSLLVHVPLNWKLLKWNWVWSLCRDRCVVLWIQLRHHSFYGNALLNNTFFSSSMCFKAFISNKMTIQSILFPLLLFFHRIRCHCGITEYTKSIVYQIQKYQVFFKTWKRAFK